MIRKQSKKQRQLKDKDFKFFFEIWQSRPHKSEISGAPLPYFFNKSMFFVFSHILPKSHYPEFRHKPENILLMTFEEHREWEDGNRVGSRWDWVIEKYETLKRQYYNERL